MNFVSRFAIPKCQGWSIFGMSKGNNKRRRADWAYARYSQLKSKAIKHTQGDLPSFSRTRNTQTTSEVKLDKKREIKGRNSCVMQLIQFCLVVEPKFSPSTTAGKQAVKQFLHRPETERVSEFWNLSTLAPPCVETRLSIDSRAENISIGRPRALRISP